MERAAQHHKATHVTGSTMPASGRVAVAVSASHTPLTLQPSHDAARRLKVSTASPPLVAFEE
jgi:hypothetical protein